MKFFFEDGNSQQPEKDSDEKQFFSMLQDAGVVQQPGDKPQEISSAASMKSLVGKVVTIEYGTYEDTYALHLTPTHPKRNLSDEQKVYDAMYQLAVIMNEYVPPTLQVKLYPPRADWQMKIISAVVEGGASAWNFDVEKFEAEAVARIHAAVEKVAMR